jgi:membrane-associated phospholipid phosphatase
MVALPVLFWFGRADIGRGLTTVLALGVYVSALFKDLLCLPRPKAPPVRRLVFSNSNTHLEYGFPSTHTTNAVSVGLFLLSYSEQVWWNVLIYVYMFSVSFGRIYCGMHGLVDVLTGVVLGVGVWHGWLVGWGSVDAWILRSGFEGTSQPIVNRV